MSKFGMFTKGTNESSSHVAVIDVATKQEAEAYFAGRKQLSLLQFHNMFVVREIQDNTRQNKNLLLG
tara:strand:- start:4056 stop:4256 length:201 start_codon:yes stop_codon:yes gene_type:complete